MNNLEEIHNELEVEEELIPKARFNKRRHFSLEKTTSHFQEQIAETEPYLKWDNKSYFKDRARLYAVAFNRRMRKDEPSVISILRWAKEKGCHIKGLISVLLKP